MIFLGTTSVAFFSNFFKILISRFYCAKAVEKRSRLDFDGNRRIWSLEEICDNLEGNSALYVFCEVCKY